jgi:non-ribosomal peptide synthetase component F
VPGTENKVVAFRTGDVGRVVNAEGEVECMGRVDSQVKIRGDNPKSADFEVFQLNQPSL